MFPDRTEDQLERAMFAIGSTAVGAYILESSLGPLPPELYPLRRVWWHHLVHGRRPQPSARRGCPLADPVRGR